MATYAYEIQRTDVHAGIDSIDSIDSSPFAYQCISAIDDRESRNREEVLRMKFLPPPPPPPPLELTLGREHKLTPHVVRRWRSFALMLAWMSIVVNFAMAVVAFGDRFDRSKTRHVFLHVFFFLSIRLRREQSGVVWIRCKMATLCIRFVA